MLTNDFYKTLGAMRKLRGYTIEQISRINKCSISTVYRFERGDVKDSKLILYYVLYIIRDFKMLERLYKKYDG